MSKKIQKKIEVANRKCRNNIELRKDMNKIDQVITEGMINAEKKCRKIKVGAVPFSPKLAMVGTKVKLWSLIVRHHKGKNIKTRYIRRIEKKCNMKKTLSTSYNKALRMLNKAIKEYKKLKKGH